MKYLKKINELNADTYKRAAEKAKEYGQDNTYRELMKMYYTKKKTPEEKMIDDLFSKSFKMRIEEVFHEGDNTKVEPRIIDLNITEIDVPDDDLSFIFLDSKEMVLFREDIKDIDIDDPIVLYFTISNNFGKPHIECLSYRNKFPSRKDFNIFMKLLEKYYFIQDKNKVAKMIAKISDKEVSDMKNGDFHVFINENFGSFEKFKSMVNPRKYYDRF